VKFGLALSGGGLMGFAHLGVLKVLNKVGFKPDVIAGTSAGAVIGALYARGMKPKEMLGIKNRFSFLKVMRFDSPFDGLSSLDGVREALEPYLGGVKFKDLDTKLLVTATDLKTGKGVVIEKGLVIDALAASVCVPGLFNPVKKGDQLLVDGLIANPVPIHTLKECGVKRVVSVSLDLVKPTFDSTSILNVINRSVQIIGQNLMELQEAEADIAIKVPVYDFNTISVKQAGRLFELGELASRKHLAELKKLIKK